MMLKKPLKIAQIIMATLAIPILTASCTNIDKQESTGQYFDSSVLTAKVKAKLLADNSVKSLPITVKTYKNTVQLSGFVDNNYQKQRAIQITKEVEGVTNVKNSLVIKSR